MDQKPPSTLTPVQAQVFLALSQGATVAEAAQSTGIHRTTIYKWLQNIKEFDQLVGDARAHYIFTLQDQILETSDSAIAKLRTILDNPATPLALQAKVALQILRHPLVRLAWDSPHPAALPADPKAAAPPPSPPAPAAPIRQISTNREIAVPAKSAAPQPPAPPPTGPKVGRNQLCPCGSGKKFKRCCLGKSTAH